MIEVNLEKVLIFYDFDSTVRRHSNALKTLAGEELNLHLLCHYLSEKCEASAQIQDECCKTKGKRLDAWVSVKDKAGDLIYYQVEVKSWSFHGYGGGTPLNVSVTPSELQRYKIDLWSQYWDSHSQTFKNEQLRKVLTRMDQYGDKKVLPLACLWAAVHPDGADDEFFEVACNSDAFREVMVFSASSYIRSMIRTGQKTIILDLKDTEERMRLIDNIFSCR